MSAHAALPDVGLCLTAGRGDAELRLFGATGHSPTSLLQVASQGDTQACLLGRLYYRADLAQRLPRLSAPDRSAPDVRWVLAAYAAFGDEIGAVLEGEFAVVILDRRRQRIVALRDPCGGYPLYWTRTADGVGVASLLRPLADLKQTTEIDRELLGEILTIGYAEIDDCASSALRGIQRLVPGTALTADLATGDVATRRFWDWQARIVQPPSRDLDEAGARYAALLRAAVDERLRGNVAAHVSGGMDSTAVAYLALDRLSASGQPLHGLSIVYERLNGLRHEAPYLEAALARPGIIRHTIAGDDTLDFDHLDAAPLLDEPCPGLFRAGTDMALVEAAARCGADTVLTGLGADELVSDAPFYIADLLRAGRLPLALSEASRWARASTTSRWRFLSRFGIEPLTPAWARMGRRGEGADEPWVLPGFAREVRLREKSRRHVRQDRRAAKSVVLSEALARLRHTAGDWTRSALAARYGLHVAHPFRDPRLVGFALGVRARIRPDPHRQKAVLASAMRSILPPIILDRRGKAPFNAVYFRGLSRNLHRLEALIEQAPVDTLELFDKARMIVSLREAALGGRAVASLSSLNNGLAICRWLSQWPQWMQSTPTPSSVIRLPATAAAEHTTGLAQAAQGGRA
ncbi:MAG: asparagine synthase-related protein [Reyranellaceae bacterium]